MFTQPPKLTDEQKEQIALGKALRSSNFQGLDEETGEMIFEFAHTYEGTLEFYFETGMEGHASIVHDDRGWHESPDFNNETKKWDGPLTKFKSLEWGVFIRGGEYLEVFKDDEKIWEGLLVNDPLEVSKRDYAFHFIPLGVEFEKWAEWCQKEYKAVIYTNEPVLAEDPEHQKYKESLNNN